MTMHWKSKIFIGRLPLIHIAIGMNEQGEKEPAIGIIAVGRRAFGVIAIGQFAAGFITVAQFGIGLVAGVGQFMAGAAILAQFALGPVAAVGQFALGWFSIGQIAVGYMGVCQAGWHRVTRNWLADLDVEYSLAWQHAGDSPLLLVYAGGEPVREWCRANNCLFVPERTAELYRPGEGTRRRLARAAGG